ncbi:leucine--tRNA ligase, partial [Candidatus Azambacteria bacterium]|nr:leucine--tRNA ligase [Candidatus Azambacteria bacterium]
MRLYNHTKIERKWQAKWLRSQVYEPRLAGAKKPFYNLMMFPYPSAEGLHVGNVYAFTGSDIYGRFKRMQGYDVFEPIGLDGFGIHSENYALSIGKHPMKLAKVTEKTFYRQLGMIGNGFSWKERLETYDPEYYRWTQWIFLQMYKHGLAYRKKSPVNWCPSCKTVLADEQVISGACERCFKITEYAEKLLKNLETLDWSERVKIAQRNWIGRSEGATIRFKLIVPGQAERHAVDVFTTRPDTLFGATFLAVSPELAKRWLDIGWKLAAAVKRYIEKSLAARGKRDEAAAKTGVFSGIQAVNPVNQKKIPVWVTDYVLGSVGTGALFGDAHDERDVAFAKKYHIPLKPTLKTGDAERDARIKRLEVCFTDDGILYDSGKFSGLTSAEARTAITQWLEEKKQGRATRVYRLRDWLISRQRYWGPPIPMIYCEKCARLRQGFGGQARLPGGQGWQPVPEKDLPVKLPFVKNFRPTGTEKSPLASVPAFYKVKCPVCKGPARRETDVSDTFLDSAWYFFRYIDVKNKKAPFSKKRAKTWLPVHMYIGGAEHAVLHLLYTRFLTMAFHDFGLTHFEEPFTTFRAHGLLIKEGA